MKLTKKELERSRNTSPLVLFQQGIKAKETREKYTRTLRHVLCKTFEDIFEGSFEERVSQIVKLGADDPEWVRDLFLSLSRKLVERTKLPKDHPDYFNPSSFDNYFKPFKKLFDMNDVVFNWTRVNSTFPEMDNFSEGRGWTRDEIKDMLKFSSGAIDRAIVLVAASSGIRIGGFDLNWKDVVPVYRIDGRLALEITESEEKKSEIACAMLQIYAGSTFAYPAFITPEAFSAMMDYKTEWTREVGRPPKPDEPVFKKEGNLPRRATSQSIKKRVTRMARKADLRIPLVKGKKRFDVPLMNGFRRFWNKACKESVSKDSPVASLIKKEYMMGHTGLVKLDRNYFKTHVLELAEEYLNTVPNLTISDEERLRMENRKKQDRINQLDRVNQSQYDEMKKELHQTRVDMLSWISDAVNDPEKFYHIIKKMKANLKDDPEKYR